MSLPQPSASAPRPVPHHPAAVRAWVRDRSRSLAVEGFKHGQERPPEAMPRAPIPGDDPPPLPPSEEPPQPVPKPRVPWPVADAPR